MLFKDTNLKITREEGFILFFLVDSRLESSNVNILLSQSVDDYFRQNYSALVPLMLLTDSVILRDMNHLLRDKFCI